MSVYAVLVVQAHRLELVVEVEVAYKVNNDARCPRYQQHCDCYVVWSPFVLGELAQQR